MIEIDTDSIPRVVEVGGATDDHYANLTPTWPTWFSYYWNGVLNRLQNYFGDTLVAL